MTKPETRRGAPRLFVIRASSFIRISGFVIRVFSHASGFLSRLNALHQPTDDVLDTHSLRLRPIVNENAMAERRVDQGADVVGRDVRPAGQQGPGLAAQDQVLGGAKAGAP